MRLSDLPPNYQKQIHEQTAKTMAPRSQVAVSEPAIRDESLGQGEISQSGKKRIDLRFHSFTRRRCDPDNCTVKYVVDWLRQEGFIPDDTDDDIRLTIKQTEVKTDEEVGVLIEIL